MKTKLVFVALLFFSIQFSAQNRPNNTKSDNGQAQAAENNKQSDAAKSGQGTNTNDQTPVIKSNVQLVTVDFVLTNKRGDIISHDNNFTKADFEILENGVPQTINSFDPTDAELKVFLLIDYSVNSTRYSFYSDREIWYGPFALIDNLKENDWVAGAVYDKEVKPLFDFTQDKEVARRNIDSLRNRIPMWKEGKMSSAIWDSLDRLGDQNHRFAIVLLSSGFDDNVSNRDFNKEVLPKARNSRVVFYPVSIGGNLRVRGYEDWVKSRSRFGEGMEFALADNRLKQLAKATGGEAYFPRFTTEFREIFYEIANRLRSQFTISYYPTDKDFGCENKENKKKNKERKIEIRFTRQVDINQDGKIDKNDKVIVVAKESYSPCEAK